MSSLKYMREEWAEENIVYYFEINDVGTALRQITVSPERIIVSNRPFGEEHFYLSDQDVPFIPELEIRREVFEALWTQGIEPFQADWQRMREQYLPGQVVEGVFEVIYPQGFIIRIDEAVYGLADYWETREASGSDSIYPDRMIRGIIKGYDQTNLWLILQEAKVV